MQDSDIIITHHAKEQARRRLGLSEKAILRLARKALEINDRECQMDGTDKVWLGEKCFIFSGMRIVTVYNERRIAPFSRTYRKGIEKIVQIPNRHKRSKKNHDD